MGFLAARYARGATQIRGLIACRAGNRCSTAVFRYSDALKFPAPALRAKLMVKITRLVPSRDGQEPADCGRLRAPPARAGWRQDRKFGGVHSNPSFRRIGAICLRCAGAKRSRCSATGAAKNAAQEIDLPASRSMDVDAQPLGVTTARSAPEPPHLPGFFTNHLHNERNCSIFAKRTGPSPVKRKA
jgi:hypothetical protein